MSDKIILPPDEIMRQMASMAMEHAADYFAKMADKFSKNLPPNTTGKDALEAFAGAIRSTNHKIYPPSENGGVQ